MANMAVIEYDSVTAAQTIVVDHPWYELFSSPLDAIPHLHESLEWKLLR